MISFLFRLALRAATVQKYKFFSLTITIAVASALLVILSSLYLNAESQLKLKLSGVPNIVVEPQKSIVNLTQLTTDDVLKLKSEEHFWRNNVVNAAPVQQSELLVNGHRVKAAGTWFDEKISMESETYQFGILNFSGWKYEGQKPGANSIILGKQALRNLKIGDSVEIRSGEYAGMFEVAGTVETGSYWDDYVFLSLKGMNRFRGDDALSEILVSSLIKPKDDLAVRAEMYGIESLNPEEYEAWYCSPYASSIAQTIKEVLPNSRVRVLRRITEVQEGIIRASSGVFMALFVATLITAVMAIFSAEKMYITSKLKDFGIMAALGASRQKAFIQVLLEIIMASLLSVAVTYLIGKTLVTFINSEVFGLGFTAEGTLLLTSAAMPLLLAVLVALILVKKTFEKNVVEILR